MMTIRRSFGFLIVAVALAVGLFAGYAVANQPHMVNARNFLNQAKAELQLASHNKGGHRDNAINLINQAITEVNLGIDAAR